ncbi:D-lyxose/D-mannose family sugar isomerase [bacterium]|nr:D-lyxose/D-mannose family sugar isomerase [bacterium]
MKRSEINATIQLALDVFEAFQFRLPKWASWSLENWIHCGDEIKEIQICRLGWHVTDFGAGRFIEEGLAHFLIRNGPGKPAAPANRIPPRPYSEKIVLLQKNQAVPFLRHPHRMKDLVNRGGGDLLVQVYQQADDGGLDREQRVPTSVNGIFYNLKAGGVVRLAPGDGITIPPNHYHKFWADNALCLIGEVSPPVDEPQDIRFLDVAEWLPSIEEDEPALYALSHEYPALQQDP